MRVGWLYTRLSAVSAGCMTVQTQRPENVEAPRYVQKEFGCPEMRSNGLYSHVLEGESLTR
jgi:hypothetical protein